MNRLCLIQTHWWWVSKEGEDGHFIMPTLTVLVLQKFVNVSIHSSFGEEDNIKLRVIANQENSWQQFVNKIH